MKTFKFSEGIVVAVVLTLLIGVALYLRVYLPYEHVFSGEWIKFTGIDAYYHMRLVDNLVTHFPERITFDPYTQYPYGRAIGWPPLFDWLLAGTIWLVSLGSPSQHTVDVVGVYFPAILGGLTLIPVYFIGKELFNHWVGIISAGLVAVLPSAFFSRSILGFTDHHVAETLFTTVTMLFLIVAIRSAKHKQLTFGHLRCKEWSVIVKPCVFSLLAGISLGMYILTWSGGLLFIFLIFIYLIIQSIIDHLKGENIDYLAIIGTTSLLIALIISLPLLPQGVWSRHLYLPSFILATLTAVGLTGVSHVFMNQRIRPLYYPITLIGLGLAGLAIFYFVAPSLLQSMLGRFDIFTPAGAKLTIMEVRPLLLPVGDFSFNLAWVSFNTAFFLGLIALIILICLMVKRSTADRNLFVVWSLLMFVAVLGQRRFGYYYTINLALLTAYLSIPIYLTTQLIIDYFRNRNTKDRRIAILQYVGLIQKSAEPVDMPLIRKRDKTKTKRRADSIITNRICATIGAIAIFFLVFFPSIGTSIAIAKEPKFSPDNAWLETLSWLRENTPEPLSLKS